MITFSLAIVALILGFLFYGKYVERIFGTDKDRPTPAITMKDGVDYIPIPTWRVFLIQFLNIAGTGPIFGAVLGIMFGPAAYLWIVFGCIFIGAVHDFYLGMISLRYKGISLPEIVGHELGTTARRFIYLFSLMLLLLLGGVYVITCSDLLAVITGDALNITPDLWKTIWIGVIFTYFLLATLLPIDTLIGKLYPVFGAALLIMAVGVCWNIFALDGWMPEITDAPFVSHHPNGTPLLPFLCITIACGAVSGFHGTQSPLMARCLTNERKGRLVFYGAMITEGIVACIWAAAAIKFAAAQKGVMGEAAYAELPTMMNGDPAILINMICTTWMGRIGALLAILGVVAAPITSGDTAFRSARLIIADLLHFRQDKLWRRIALAVPCFAVANVVMSIDFSVLWRYFAWANQTLATFTLWAITVWLQRHKKNFYIALFPALFMTVICNCYILRAKEGFSLPAWIGWSAAFLIAAVCLFFFIRFCKKTKD